MVDGWNADRRELAQEGGCQEDRVQWSQSMAHAKVHPRVAPMQEEPTTEDW
jgi:hypothetical protein